MKRRNNENENRQTDKKTNRQTDTYQELKIQKCFVSGDSGTIPGFESLTF